MKLVIDPVDVLYPWHSFQPYPHRLYKSFLLPAIVLVLALLGSRAANAITYTVTDLADNPADTGSLRYAVNTAVNGDTIAFAPNVIGTITLTNGTLIISQDITIDGPGAVLLTISGNHAVSVLTLNGGATVAMSGLTIANGQGSGDHGTDGGAIYGDGTLTVTSCTFSNNTASAFGGAIDLFGTLVVNSSTFSGNSSSGGAAITVNSTTTVNNSTFFDNVGSDGDILIPVPTTSLTVNNSTFSGNSSGSIFNLGGSTVTLTNSILADACITCGTQSANNMIGGSPHLGPLQYNGGATETMMPLPGSPAIGAGSGSNLATDQRGFVRLTGSGVASDLGAVSTNYLTVTTTADTTDAGTCAGGATCSLRDAINLANSNGSGDIVFQSGLTGTITLSSILPSVTADTNIVGPGAKLLTISGNNNFSLMDIPNMGTRVNLSGITISDGFDQIYGQSAVTNKGILSVEDSAFSNNGGNFGGAILNAGIMGVKNATFSNNFATYGAGIDNQGTLALANGTFTGNRAYNGDGGGIENSGNALVLDSTFTGNEVLNGAVGGGMDSSAGVLTVGNSIITQNTNLSTNTEDDCHNCTQSGPILTGGVDPQLGALGYYGVGAMVQTMVPLPGSPAIQKGDTTQLPVGLTNDERDFPRLTAGELDLGAVQTNYTSVAFVQQPSNTFFNTDISPAVTVQVLETNNNLTAPNNTDGVDNIPITLTLNGPGTLGGTLTQTTSGGVASFGNLTVDTAGTGDTLATTLTVTPSGITPAQTLTATSSPFDVTLHPQTITLVPPPVSVAYGVPPLMLSATSSASLPVTFQVDSGPAIVSGNVLTITGTGTVVIEADAAGNGTYAAATPVLATIRVGLGTSQMSLTASTTHAPIGSSVILTATATSTTSGVPTGRVTFLDNGNNLGAVPLNAQGVATLTLTTLPAGSNVITATYPGDANFLGSNAQLAVPILVGAPGFTMTSSVSNFTLHPGQQMQWILTFTPTFGYTGTASIACSGLPVSSKCLFAPASVTFNGSGTPVQVTVTMQIGMLAHSHRSSVAQLRPWRPLGGLPMLPAVIFWLPGTDKLLEEKYGPRQANNPNVQSKFSRMLLTALLLVLSVGAFALVGCSNLTPEPSAGQQTVTITAKGSGNITQSVSVQVTVQ